jgi:iron complex transport system substrate-binding protein
VVDTAIPPDLTPVQIDAWVRERAARGLPLYALDRAALAAAAPDLVLTQDLCRVCALPAATVAEACRVIGVDADVLSVDPHSVDDVLDTVHAIGKAAGAADVAAALASPPTHPPMRSSGSTERPG